MEQPRIQSLCNAHGIRIYPVPKYGYYFLEIEFNRSSEFNPRHKLKVVPGKEKYDPRKKEWVEKLHDLYAQLYKTKVQPKIKKKNALQQS